MIGRTIGPCQIVAKLGEGGMGQVWRARDTRLNRDVAIKVLPESFALDADRVARFTREAQTLAALNHPNIAQIFGIEESDGVRALVMELVEGEDLSALIANGQPEAESISSRLRGSASAARRGGGAPRSLSIDDVLPIAKQIASALEAAHEQGIIHRDLKPANVKVRPDGTVKVLDFGLAKAMDPAGASSADAMNSPTLTARATQAGMILGTAAYMAPEQARGKVVDRRADIWAFGAVLFEMLTGTRAFPGEDITDTLAAVVRADPPWTLLPKDLSPALVAFLRRCLQKDPKQRIGDIRDVRLALEGAFDTPSAPRAAAPTPTPRSRVARLVPVAISGLAGALLAAAAVWSWAGRAPASVAPTRTSVMVPANRPIAMGWFPGRSLALSRDGTELVYVGTNPEVPITQPGWTRLQLRSLGAIAVRDLPGTEGARQPFFSPDGQWVGFFTGTGELKKISLAGGNPVTLVEKINGSGFAFGVWAEDHTIIFGTLTTGLRRVSAEGGAVSDLTTPDAALGEQFHLVPALTLSSRAVLFSGSPRAGGRIDAVRLDSGERRAVIEHAGRPLLLGSGHLLFQRDDAILIAPFDEARLAVTGPAVPLPDVVRRDSPGSPLPVAQLAVSASGTLAYIPAGDEARALGLVRRDGAFEPLGPPPSTFTLPRASPDGHAVAFVVSRGQQSEVHVYDRRRGSTTKLTEDSRDEGLAWHPDGRSLAIYSTRKDTRGIFLRNLDGRERLLVPTPAGATVLRNAAWSPGGTQLAYTVQTGLLHDIWVMTLGDPPTTAPLLTSAASEHSPAFSPDGRWLAYVSDESGRNEIYLRPYPQGERLAVSTAGGSGPVWRRDGRELFFHGTDAGALKMMAVSVTAKGASLELGRPTPLFDLRMPGPSGAVAQYVASSNLGPAYDILPDRRFVAVRGADPTGTREIVVVQNFFEELKRLAPAR